MPNQDSTDLVTPEVNAGAAPPQEKPSVPGGQTAPSAATLGLFINKLGAYEPGLVRVIEGIVHVQRDAERDARRGYKVKDQDLVFQRWIDEQLGSGFEFAEGYNPCEELPWDAGPRSVFLRFADIEDGHWFLEYIPPDMKSTYGFHTVPVAEEEEDQGATDGDDDSDVPDDSGGGAAATSATTTDPSTLVSEGGDSGDSSSASEGEDEDEERVALAILDESLETDGSEFDDGIHTVLVLWSDDSQTWENVETLSDDAREKVAAFVNEGDSSEDDDSDGGDDDEELSRSQLRAWAKSPANKAAAAALGHVVNGNSSNASIVAAMDAVQQGGECPECDGTVDSAWCYRCD
eukprot:gene28665-64_t